MTAIAGQLSATLLDDKDEKYMKKTDLQDINSVWPKKKIMYYAGTNYDNPKLTTGNLFSTVRGRQLVGDSVNIVNTALAEMQNEYRLSAVDSEGFDKTFGTSDIN